MSHPLIDWEAPEYYHEDKSSDWFWSLGIIAITISILFILFSNILFALFVLLAAFAVGLYAARAPKIVRYEIQPKGVLADDMFYSFDMLESFWIDEDHPHEKLVLVAKKLFTPHIIIPLIDVDIAEVHETLIEVLPEVHHKESWAHKLLERFGL